MAEGTFITFEGIDGCGKSTHCQRVARWMGELGHEVVLVHDPGTTAIGEEIRKILLNPQNAPMSAQCELLLYEAARAQLVSELIEPALRRGAVVIGDRFTSSTTAYQGAGRSLAPATIEVANALGAMGCEPELTVLLTVDLELALARQGSEPDRMEAQGARFLQVVQEAYLAEARRYPERFAVIPSGGSKAHTGKRIQDAIRARLPQLFEEGGGCS